MTDKQPPDAQPLAWIRYRTDGGIEGLYATPDPRIAELEGLLRQVRDCGAMANWIGVSNTLRKRIEAALKEG